MDRRVPHRRIADIELLRGVAILFTLLEHIRFNLVTWANPALNGLLEYFHFASGVDLFLAISGFVIARSLVPALATCETRLDFARATLAFWVRRAWRLIPSAWLWLAIILAASAFFNRSNAFESFHTNFESAVAAVLNVANARAMYAFGHFPYGASSPYWSLSLEEQFYLLFPILIFVSRRWLPFVLGTLVLLQLFTVRTLMLMTFRTDALMLGALLALWAQTEIYRVFEPRFLQHGRLVRGGFLVVLLLCLAALDVPQTSIVWFPVGLISVISAALVFVASFDRDYLMPEGPLKRVLLWCGSRSYALYLVHMPVMLATREVWLRLGLPPAHGHGWWLLLAAFGAIAIAAELNFRFVETPLRLKGGRIADAIAAGRAAPIAAPESSVPPAAVEIAG